MLLQGFGARYGAFEEHAVGIFVVGDGGGGAARVGGVLEGVVVAVFAGALADGFKRKFGAVFQYLQGGIGFEFHADLFLEFQGGHGHEADGLQHAGAQFLPLFHGEGRALNLQSILHS